MTGDRTSTEAHLSALALLLSLLLLPVATPVRAAQVREIREVKVAYPPSMASVTLMTGIKQKFFDDEGLRPTLLIITSDLALKSQVVGEIDYTLFGGGSGLLAAAQGLPIKSVHLAHKFADLTLVARPEFKSVAQLRGKNPPRALHQPATAENFFDLAAQGLSLPHVSGLPNLTRSSIDRS